MKISRIRIQGFRTIEKVLDCRLQNLTIFTGPNNAGKSGIVRALDLFFNNGGDPTKCLPHVRRNPDAAERQKRFTILITLWFFDLPNDLATKYAQYINKQKELPVRLRFYPKSTTLDYLLFSQGSVRNGVSDGTVSKSIHEDLCRHLLLRVIPESRDIQREFKTELGEAFAALRESVVEAAHSKAARAAAELHDALNEIVEKELSKRLNRNMGKVIPDHTFKVGALSKSEFARIVMQEALTRYPMCAASPDGDEFPLDQIGAGFQSNVLIALHRAVAALAGKQLLLCVEEPEIHLDPTAQRRAYHEWHHLSRESNEVEQIVITSHSAFIVNEARPEELVVVRRDERKRTICSQLTPEFLEKHDVLHLRMKVLGLKNSDLFFATGVVLVEGDSDAVALRGCLDLLLQKEPSATRRSTMALGLSIIECGGAKSLVPLARVLRELGIPFLMVFDRDFLQKTDSNAGAERTFHALPADTFDSLADLFSSPTVFSTAKTFVVSHFSAGVPNGYPLAINRELQKHGVLVMRTEHETDFIDDNTAAHVAAVVGYDIPAGQDATATAGYLRTNHRKQIKQATNTARVLAKMTIVQDIPVNYFKLCKDILKAFGN